MNERALSKVWSVIRTTFDSFFTNAGRTAAHNLVWVGTWTFLTQLCALVSVYLLTEGLGQQRYGILSFALGVQVYLYAAAGGGMRQVVIREGVRLPEDIDCLRTAHLVMTTSASTMLCLITACIVFLTSAATDEKVLLCALAMGNVANCINPMPFFDLHHQQRLSAFLVFITELCSMVAIAWLVVARQLGLEAVGSVLLVKWTVNSLLHFMVYHRCLHPTRLRFSSNRLRSFGRSSWPLIVSNVLLMVPISSGVFFVRAMHGPGDTAILGLAQHVATAYLMFATIGVRLLQPHIAGRYGQTWAFLKKLTLFSTAYLGSLLLVVWLGAGLAITILLPAEYHDAVWPATLMLLGAALAAVGRIGAMYLVVLRRENDELRCQFAATIIYLVGCAVLVPQYSYYAAAFMLFAANLSGDVFMLVTLLISRKRHTDVPQDKLSEGENDML